MKTIPSCPECGYIFYACAQGITGKHTTTPPPGAYGFCESCLHLLVVTPDHQFRKVTDAELSRMPLSLMAKLSRLKLDMEKRQRSMAVAQQNN